MLLGAAQHLARDPDFSGTLNLIFQPAEEGLGGAREMIEDGLFERFPCDRVYALHNWPGLPAGTIATRPGAIMGAADKFRITLDGQGRPRRHCRRIPRCHPGGRQPWCSSQHHHRARCAAIGRRAFGHARSTAAMPTT
jgi:hypothetical protein